MKRIYNGLLLDMDEYCVVSNGSSARNFRFKDLISCSAIVFKCEGGYAGFHYSARGLMSNGSNDYIIAMKIMILDIASSIGNIQKVNCFTPILTDAECYENESYEDMDRIENFFKDYGYNCAFVDNLSDIYVFKGY